VAGILARRVLDQCRSQLCSIVEGMEHTGDLLPDLVSLTQDHDGVTRAGPCDGFTNGCGAVADLADPPGIDLLDRS